MLKGAKPDRAEHHHYVLQCAAIQPMAGINYSFCIGILPIDLFYLTSSSMQII